MAPDTALLQRLDQLESRMAIQDLVHRYCWGADHRDEDVWLSAWAPHAVWQVSPDQSFTGHDQTRQAVRYQWDVMPRMLHATTNHRIWVDGDRGTGVADVVLLAQSGGHTEDEGWFVGGGTYRDEYVRLESQWLLLRRAAKTPFTVPIPSARRHQEALEHAPDRLRAHRPAHATKRESSRIADSGSRGMFWGLPALDVRWGARKWCHPPGPQSWPAQSNQDFSKGGTMRSFITWISGVISRNDMADRRPLFPGF